MTKLIAAVKFYWWLRVRRHLTSDEMARTIAWLLPRRVALHAFVRVYAGTTSEAPHEEYSRVYKSWERGVGA